MPKSNEPVGFDDFEKRLREKEKKHLDLLHLLNDLNWLKKLLALFEVLFIHIKSNLDKIKISEDDYLLNLKNFENLVAPNVGEENIGMILNILRERGNLPANIENIKEMKWEEFLEYLEKAFENLFNSIKGFYTNEKLKNKVLKTLGELMSQIDLYLERLSKLLPFDQILIKDRPSSIIGNIREKYREFLERIKKEAEDVKDMFEDEVLGYLRERIDEFQEKIKEINTEWNDSLKEIEFIIRFSELLIRKIRSKPNVIIERRNVIYGKMKKISSNLLDYRDKVSKINRDLSELFKRADTRRLKKKEKAQNLFDSLKESFEIVLEQIAEVEETINSLISEVEQLENLSVETGYEESLQVVLLQEFNKLLGLLEIISNEIRDLFEEIEKIKKFLKQ